MILKTAQIKKEQQDALFAFELIHYPRMNQITESVSEILELSCLHDQDGRFTWVPPQAEALLGYSSTDLEGANPYDYIHPEDRSRVIKAGYLQASLKRKSNAVHYRFRHKDGSYRWMYSITRVESHADGSVKQIYSSSWPSTALPDFEQQLYRKYKQDHNLEHLLQVGTWELHLPSAHIRFSPKALELLDWPDIPPMASLERLEWLGFPKVDLMQYLESIDGEGQRFSEELFWREQDGTHRWFRIRGQVMQASGSQRQLVGSLKDITEEVLHRKYVRTTFHQLQHANQHLRNFNQMMSHNLRAPAGNLELLLDLLQKADSEEERQEYIAMLRELSGNLKDSLNELTEASAAQYETLTEEVSLQKAWEAAERLLFVDIKAGNAIIEVDFSAALHVRYNRHYLENIFYNLVNNALKYAFPSRQPHIQIRSRVSESDVVLTIKDNGRGIDLGQHRASLFKEGSTFHQHPEAKGLGLFMVDNQVKSRGGRIEVDSEVGIGTTFKVVLGKAADLQPSLAPKACSN